jgi:hypothetical protein
VSSFQLQKLLLVIGCCWGVAANISYSGISTQFIMLFVLLAAATAIVFTYLLL